MGLYSEVVNRCPALGDEFLGVLQTKDLTALLDTYWLTPSGELFHVDDAGTWDLELSEPQEQALPPIKRVSTGKHGRVRPYRYSGVMTLVAAAPGGALEAVVHFKCGTLNAVLCKGPIFSCRSTVCGA